MNRNLQWAIPLCVSICVSCSGNSNSPSVPASAQAPKVSLASLDIPERTAMISWTAIDGATGYEISVGTSAGGADVAKVTVNGGTTTTQLPNLPTRATIYVSIIARTASSASQPGATSFYLVDFRSITETLFLSSGPYSATQFGVDSPRQEMSGWPSGTRIRILLSSEVEDLRPVAELVAAQLGEMTAGALSAYVETGGDNRWTGAVLGPAGTVKVVSTRDVPFPLCTGVDGGSSFDCARADPDRLPVRTRVVLWMGPDLKPGNRGPVFGHELGHALVGFMHWDGYFDAPGSQGVACFPNSPQMQFPYLKMCGRQEAISNGLPEALRLEFSPIEVEAARRVYGAGLRAGSPRGEFVSRGLIP
jgi:hypothetical protein